MKANIKLDHDVSLEVSQDVLVDPKLVAVKVTAKEDGSTIRYVSSGFITPAEARFLGDALHRMADACGK